MPRPSPPPRAWRTCKRGPEARHRAQSPIGQQAGAPPPQSHPFHPPLKTCSKATLASRRAQRSAKAMPHAATQSGVNSLAAQTPPRPPRVAHLSMDCDDVVPLVPTLLAVPALGPAAQRYPVPWLLMSQGMPGTQNPNASQAALRHPPHLASAPPPPPCLAPELTLCCVP